MTAIREARPYDGLAVGMAGGRYADMGSAITTAPVSNVQEGYMFVGFAGTLPVLGVVMSSVAVTGIRYIQFNNSTWGRTTND